MVDARVVLLAPSVAIEAKPARVCRRVSIASASYLHSLIFRQARKSSNGLAEQVHVVMDLLPGKTLCETSAHYLGPYGKSKILPGELVLEARMRG